MNAPERTDWRAIAALVDSGRRYQLRELYALCAKRDRKAAVSWTLARYEDRLGRREPRWRYERIDPAQVPADVQWQEWPHATDHETAYGAEPGRRHRKSYGAPYMRSIRWSTAEAWTYKRTRFPTATEARANLERAARAAKEQRA